MSENKVEIVSRINTFIPEGLMKELNTLCENRLISDNNTKARMIMVLFEKYNVEAEELGPGTNRMAVLIDGYVFKIAMDKWGKRDNDNEYAMSEELQPFVIKVYETNTLITVSEYVTLISPEEFAEKRSEILNILSTLAEGYLIGDVGYQPKNFTNWGYRDNGDLVILDFAYIYNIIGDELMCPDDGETLHYDPTFHYLRCPYCRVKFSFTDVRRLVTMEQEDYEVNRVKAESYILKGKKSEMFSVDGDDNAKDLEEEIQKEKQKELDEVKKVKPSEEAYFDLLEDITGVKAIEPIKVEKPKKLEELDHSQPVFGDVVTTEEVEEVSEYDRVLNELYGIEEEEEVVSEPEVKTEEVETPPEEETSEEVEETTEEEAIIIVEDTSSEKADVVEDTTMESVVVEETPKVNKSMDMKETVETHDEIVIEEHPKKEEITIEESPVEEVTIKDQPKKEQTSEKEETPIIIESKPETFKTEAGTETEQVYTTKDPEDDGNNVLREALKQAQQVKITIDLDD